MASNSLAAVTCVLMALGAPVQAEDQRATVAAPVGTLVLKVHAVGAQIYQCRTDAGGTLLWTLREPIATLISDGKTLGRHFAGPSWQLPDGSLIMGSVSGKADGDSPGDIPWLRLDVVQNTHVGLLKDVTIVQRIETAGGSRSGGCPHAGDLAAEPYSADYLGPSEPACEGPS